MGSRILAVWRIEEKVEMLKEGMESGQYAERTSVARMAIEGCWMRRFDGIILGSEAEIIVGWVDIVKVI